MYKFITAAEAIKKLNIKTFQLFELMITGRLEAYTEYGKKVINSDVLEHRPMDTLERIFANLKAKQKAATLGASHTHRSDEELQGMAKKRYRQQPLVIVNQPPDTEAVSFTKLSNNMQLAIETVMKFLFREIKIATIQSADGLPVPAKSESSRDHRSKEEGQETLAVKRWIYGWELLQLRDWTALELLNHIKNGLPAYDGEVGRRIIDLDTLPRQKQTHEEIAESIRCKFVNRDTNISVGDIEPGSGAAFKGSDEFGEEWISKICEDVYESQPGTPIIPTDSEPMSLKLPPGNAEALAFLDVIKSFCFRYQEVLAYEQNNGLAVKEQEEFPLRGKPNTTPSEKPRDNVSFTDPCAVNSITIGEERLAQKPEEEVPLAPKMSDFDKDLLGFAKRKRKKNPSLSVPDIARQALREKEDFLSLGRYQNGKLPKQETIEKHLRKLQKQHK